MCKFKESGGLGFRDLKLFNQALIAKQSWCILRNPSSLVSKVLKGCYFKDEDFLNAQVKANAL